MPSRQKTNSNRSCSWTKCSTQFCCGWVFDWRLTKGDTNCAECGSAYPPHEKNAKKQWNDISMTTQFKDVFWEIFPSLPKVAQEKHKIFFTGLIQTTENPKPTFLAQQQRDFTRRTERSRSNVVRLRNWVQRPPHLRDN